MELWESIIAKKMRPCAKLAEDVAHQRKLEMPSAVTIALQDIGLMTVHLVRSAAA